MRQKIAKIQCYCNVLNFNQFKALLFQFKIILPLKNILLPFTFNHKSFLSISIMSNRNFSYIFSPDILRGNVSSQSETGLCNLTFYIYLNIISSSHLQISFCILFSDQMNEPKGHLLHRYVQRFNLIYFNFVISLTK